MGRRGRLMADLADRLQALLLGPEGDPRRRTVEQELREITDDRDESGEDNPR